MLDTEDKDGSKESAIDDGDLSINAWPTAEDVELEQPRGGAQAEKAISVRSVLARTVSRQSWKDPGPPPDGGTVAWTQCALVHLTTFSTFGYITSFGSFLTYYETVLDVSPSAISWLGSVQIFLLFFIGTFSGRALDAGLFHYVYGAGSILQLLGIFTTSISTKYWQLFLAQAVCTGLANGLHFTPATSLLTTYFAKKRSLVIGFAALGSSTGGIVIPVIVQQLLPRIGFPWTVRVIGFIMLATNLITFSLYRTRLPPRRTGPLVEWSAFTELPYMLYCGGAFFLFWGLYFAFFFVGAFGRNVLGMSYPASINVLLVMACMGLVFRVLPNFFADRIGPLNMIVPFAFVCGLMMFVWISIDSPAGLFGFGAAYGIGAAGIQSMFPATLASLTDDLSKAGVRMGMGFSIVSLACLTGAPLAGALIQVNDGDYTYAQM